METQALEKLVLEALEDIKAVDILKLPVKDLTYITDTMIICSGTSSRHVKAIANNVVEHVKQQGTRPLGVEGQQDGEWVLIDFANVVIHVMQPQIREFYHLEKLWMPIEEEAQPPKQHEN